MDKFTLSASFLHHSKSEQVVLPKDKWKIIFYNSMWSSFYSKLNEKRINCLYWNPLPVLHWLYHLHEDIYKLQQKIIQNISVGMSFIWETQVFKLRNTSGKD